MRAGRMVFWLAVALLAAPALLLTATRLADTDIGVLIRIESFTPLAVPLYAALIVVLSLAAALRREQRRARLAAALLALLLLGVHLWWFAPQVFGDNPEPAPGGERLTVMNSNLFAGAGDAGDVVAAVRRDGVDVLVTEEITPTALERLDAAGLADLLPYRAGGTDPAVAGTMVFSDLPIGDSVMIDTPFQSYKVEVGPFTLLAVHPTAPVLPRAWLADHRVILEEAEAVDADLVVGDLNATPDHSVMRALDDAGLRDAGELANEGWQPTWPANHLGLSPLAPPLVCIDHVLVSDTLASLGTHTVDIAGTDHLALVAELAPRT